MPSGVISGWLEKRGGGGGLVGSTKYQHRWFVLDSEATVRYYKAQPTRASDEPQGSFNAQGAGISAASKAEIEVAVQASVEGQAGAPLSQKQRVFHLRAESAVVRDRWLGALQAAADGSGLPSRAGAVPMASPSTTTGFERAEDSTSNDTSMPGKAPSGRPRGFTQPPEGFGEIPQPNEEDEEDKNHAPAASIPDDIFDSASPFNASVPVVEGLSSQPPPPTVDALATPTSASPTSGVSLPVELGSPPGQLDSPPAGVDTAPADLELPHSGFGSLPSEPASFGPPPPPPPPPLSPPPHSAPHRLRCFFSYGPGHCLSSCFAL